MTPHSILNTFRPSCTHFYLIDYGVAVITLFTTLVYFDALYGLGLPFFPCRFDPLLKNNISNSIPDSTHSKARIYVGHITAC